ncbi:uncharacterized protein [Primulina huaijiensis]|uniref:uncharacterized protein n=1 Tax=Primulina huaijiensis TaxID=1492673 RepID=UPI003CC7021A
MFFHSILSRKWFQLEESLAASVRRLFTFWAGAASVMLLRRDVKDDTGAIRIQRSHKGPFYVSDKLIDQLIANLGKWSRNNFYQDWSVNRKQREVSFHCNRRCLAKGWRSMFQEKHESNSLLSRELTNGSMKATTYKKKMLFARIHKSTSENAENGCQSQASYHLPQIRQLHVEYVTSFRPFSPRSC